MPDHRRRDVLGSKTPNLPPGNPWPVESVEERPL